MEQVTNIVGKFLNGKPIFTQIKRILDVIFIASISSYIFESYSGKYEWLNYDDYKGILDFFIKGKFIIPLSIYLFVFYLTTFISSNILVGLIIKKSHKYQNKIRGINLQLEKIESNELTNENFLTGENLKKYFPIPKAALDLYVIISESLKGRITFEKLRFEIDREKNEFQLTLNLLFRALIALIFYFIALPALGKGLFFFLVFTIIIIIIVFSCGLLLLNILPSMIQKLNIEMNKLLELRKNNPKTE